MKRDKQQNVITMFVNAAQKFIAKVEDGRARSRVTYSDLKACVVEAAKLHVEFDPNKPNTPLQRRILYVLRLYGPATDSELVWRFNSRIGLAASLAKAVSASTIRSRRAELVALGRVRDTLNPKRSESGRKETVWEATPAFITAPQSRQAAA